MRELKGKIFLITGCNGIVGTFIAKELLKYKSILILTDYENLKNKNLIKNKNVFFYKCDLASRSSINNFVNKIKIKHKKIDVLVNNAAITGAFMEKRLPTKGKLEVWDSTMEINLTAIYQLIPKLKPILNKSKAPSIINISSIHGILSADWSLYKGTKMRNYASYSTSKGAVIHLSKWFASALGPKIRVNSISPGGIHSNQPGKFVKRYLSKTVIKRMAQPKDILGSIIFLSTSLSDYITGQNIIIDGGYSLA